MIEPKEIIFRDTGKTAMWACGKCGDCYTLRRYGENAKSNAEACCAPVFCSCGAELTDPYRQRDGKCADCDNKAFHAKEDAREAERFEKAEKLAEQPADSGMLYCGDEYFTNWEDIIDRYGSNAGDSSAIPEYAWATETCSWRGLDVGTMLESDSNNYHVEDRDLIDEVTDLQELGDFITAWNAKQRVTWFEPDFTRAILRPTDYLKYFDEQEAA